MSEVTLKLSMNSSHSSNFSGLDGSYVSVGIAVVVGAIVVGEAVVVCII